MSDERRSQRADSGARPAPRVRTDTIVARATAPGRSAIAIVRVSGQDAETIARRVVTPWPRQARRMTRCVVHEPGMHAHEIDDALAVFYPAPESYTGETVVEVHAHGGLYVASAVESALIQAGARPATPGEFTERAVLNGKLDLIRAEAVGALVDARTQAAHRAARTALSGTLTRQYESLRECTIALDAMLAYDIDFPEEDDGPVSRDRVADAARELEDTLSRLCATAPMAAVAQSGALVVLAGPPNAGKSSLLNALVGEARVIVSDEPGTTRDAVEVMLDGDPWPIRLVDTAGLRMNPGDIERLGMEVSERYLATADIVLICAEHRNEMSALHERLTGLTTGTVIEVHTKADLLPVTATTPALTVSTVTGTGLDQLRAAIMSAITRRMGTTAADAPVVTSVRQRTALEQARAEVAAFRSAWSSQQLPAAIVATHVRAAISALDQLIGRVDPDTVLERVFSTFCVGK